MTKNTKLARHKKTSSKTQKKGQYGRGLFGNKNEIPDNHNPMVYKNITYPSGGGIIPELKCLVCSNNTFRVKKMENVGKRSLKNFVINDLFGETFTDRNFKLFSCVSCGFHMHFSNKMSFVK